MAKINPDNEAPVADAIQKLLASCPVLIVGVNRKANIGNYETVDVYVGLTLPLPEAVNATEQELRDLVAAQAEVGVSIVAKETAERYTAIKNLMVGQA